MSASRKNIDREIEAKKLELANLEGQKQAQEVLEKYNSFEEKPKYIVTTYEYVRNGELISSSRMHGNRYKKIYHSDKLFGIIIGKEPIFVKDGKVLVNIRNCTKSDRFSYNFEPMAWGPFHVDEKYIDISNLPFKEGERKKDYEFFSDIKPLIKSLDGYLSLGAEYLIDRIDPSKAEEAAKKGRVKFREEMEHFLEKSEISKERVEKILKDIESMPLCTENYVLSIKDLEDDIFEKQPKPLTAEERAKEEKESKEFRKKFKKFMEI